MGREELSESDPRNGPRIQKAAHSEIMIITCDA